MSQDDNNSDILPHYFAVQAIGVPDEPDLTQEEQEQQRQAKVAAWIAQSKYHDATIEEKQEAVLRFYAAPEQVDLMRPHVEAFTEAELDGAICAHETLERALTALKKLLSTPPAP